MTMLRRSLYFALVALLTEGCECRNTVRDVIPSPDGGQKVVVYARECGATVPSNVHVSLVAATQSPTDEEPNVLSVDRGHNPDVRLDIRVKWLSADSLVVSYDQRARVFRKSDHVDGIRIRYTDSHE